MAALRTTRSFISVFVVVGIGLAWAERASASQEQSPSGSKLKTSSLGRSTALAEVTARRAKEASFRSIGPTGIAQLGTTLLALPATEVCPGGEQRCVQGDLSIALSLASLGRFGDFAFGAGITWARGLRPAEVVDGEAFGVSLEREHSRSYFAFEGLFRYYLPGSNDWQWWVGGTLGGVVVNDTWSTKADREPYSDTAYVGPRGIRLSTEGLAVGAAAGGHWFFAKQFSLGVRLRYANWIFAGERAASPLGDRASLAGRVDVIDAGLFVGYRLPF